MHFLRKIFIPFRLWRRGLSLPLEATVFGVSNPLSQGALAQSRAEDKLQIVHTPSEKLPHNVYVYSIELNRILGHLTADLSKALISVFGNGFCLDGEIAEIVGEGTVISPFGVQIVIRATTTYMQPYIENLPYYREDENFFSKE